MTEANVDVIDKPWGSETMFTTPLFIMKIIKINEGCRTSLQLHRVKDEVIHILDGEGGVEIYSHSDEMITSESYAKCVFARAGERVYIPHMHVHRSVGPVTLLEITTHPNDDIIRISDDYGRKPEFKSMP